MVGAGILLFVAAHWEEMSPALRFTMVLFMVAAFHLVGALTRRKVPTAIHCNAYTRNSFAGSRHISHRRDLQSAGALANWSSAVGRGCMGSYTLTAPLAANCAGCDPHTGVAGQRRGGCHQNVLTVEN